MREVYATGRRQKGDGKKEVREKEVRENGYVISLH